MACRHGEVAFPRLINDMNEHEFDDIKRLLRIKRNENPPPGYFRDFSSGVLAQIRRQEVQAPVPWWKNLLRPWGDPARLAWANVLTFGGLAIVGFSLYMASVTEAPPTVAKGVSPPVYGGLDFRGPSAGFQTGESLLTTASSLAPVQIQITGLDFASTNPFPEGLFRLPGDDGGIPEGVRVRLGSPR